MSDPLEIIAHAIERGWMSEDQVDRLLEGGPDANLEERLLRERSCTNYSRSVPPSRGGRSTRSSTRSCGATARRPRSARPGPGSRGNSTLASTGDHAGARASYDKSIEIEPDPRALEGRARLALEQGEFQAAIADATRAIELDPRRPQGYCVRARARLALSDCINAIEDSSRALERDAASAPSYVDRGDAVRRSARSSARGRTTNALSSSTPGTSAAGWVSPRYG